MAAAWECPALPMIHLPLKESSKTNFQPLKPLIASRYGESPESFSDEIRQLEQLRETSLKPPRDNNGCNMLRRYYAQLHLLTARFPEDSATLPIPFPWKDVFSNSEYKQEGLQLELSSILYNIGALHSQVGARDGRHSEQDMKESLTHFQCAAGAFQYSLDNHGSAGSADISPQLIEMYKNLMLAQAQECTVEKSLKGLSRVKNLNISKIAMKVSQYYQGVILVLESGAGTAILKKHKDWMKLLQLKSTLYASIAHLYQANALEEQGNYGYMIAFQQLSLQKIQGVGKLPRGTPDVLKEAVKNFTEYILMKVDTSKTQNEQVFHELVPSVETLEPAPGVELVKPIPFQPVDRRITGTDILARLIPMSAYEAASVYSEEKAKILRSITSSVEEKNEELEGFMSSLNMEEVDHTKAQNPTLPAELLTQHQLLRSKRVIIYSIRDKAQELKDLSEKVQEQLTSILQKKKDDEQEEESCQERHGPRPESQVCISMWKELQSLTRYHQQASNSNKELFNAFEKHRDNLLLLAGDKDKLLEAIPRMSLEDVSQDFSDDRWKELMEKVDEMKSQRSTLIKELRDQIGADDITRAIIGELSTNRDVLFDEYLQKHRNSADIIRQNLTAQDNILRALMEANAHQVQLRQSFHQLMKRREEWCVSLAKSAGCYTFLESKISEGLGFYTKLAESVFRLYRRCQEVCATRRRDRLALDKQAQARTTPSPVPPAPHPPKSSDAHHTPEPHPPNVSGDIPDDQDEVQKLILQMKQMQEQQKEALNITPIANNADTVATPTQKPELDNPMVSDNSNLPAPLLPIDKDTSEDQNLTPTGQDPIPIGQSPIPTGQSPLPTGQYPIPIGQNSIPNSSLIPVSDVNTSIHSTSIPNSLVPDSDRPGPMLDNSLSDAINDTAFVSAITTIAQTGGELPTPTDNDHRVLTPTIDHTSSMVNPPDHTPLLVTPPTRPDKPRHLMGIPVENESNEALTGMVNLPNEGVTGDTDGVTMGNTGGDDMTMGDTGGDDTTMGDTGGNDMTMGDTGGNDMTMGGNGMTMGDTGGNGMTMGDTGMTTGDTGMMMGGNGMTMGDTGGNGMTSEGASSHVSMETNTTTPSNYAMMNDLSRVSPRTPVISSTIGQTVTADTETETSLPSSDGPSSSLTTPPTNFTPLQQLTGTTDSTPSLPVSLTSQLQFVPPPPLSITTSFRKSPSPMGVAPSPVGMAPSPVGVAASPVGMVQPVKSSTTHLESIIASQKTILQNQSNQLSEHQNQLRGKDAMIQELRNELQLVRMRQNEQDKEKTASTGNQAMLMKLLQQQQGLFTQQQSQLDKMSKDGEARRLQTTDLEMKLRDALSQEQFQNQSLQGQVAQQNTEILHLKQQMNNVNQQLQALQAQAQQYLVQIQERDKALTNYREEHKRIVDGMETQFKQKLQQVQELQVRGNRGGGAGTFPPGLQPPLVPQQQYQPYQPSQATPPPTQLPVGPSTRGGGLMDSPNPAVPGTATKLHPTVVPTSTPISTSGQNPIPTGQNPMPTGQSPMPTGQSPMPTGQSPMPNGQNPMPARQNAMPTRQNPIPTRQNPIPTGQNPIPTGQNPMPTGQNPMSTGQNPMPTGQNPIPARQNPMPARQNPMPARQNPIPTGQNPMPARQNPMPTGQNPTGQNPIPTGQNPMPARQNTMPASQNPMPTGQNPMPTGQNPMPTGQNPMPTGQNPMPTGQNPMPTGQNPIPTGQNPMSSRQNPMHVGQIPMSTGQNPMHVGQNPMPTRQSPVSTGHNPRHIGQNPIPPGQNTIPPGPNPMPPRQNPMPSGQPSIQNLVPTGQNPQQMGQNLIPTGQNPVPTGQIQRQNSRPIGQNPMPAGQNPIPNSHIPNNSGSYTHYINQRGGPHSDSTGPHSYSQAHPSPTTPGTVSVTTPTSLPQQRPGTEHRQMDPRSHQYGQPHPLLYNGSPQYNTGAVHSLPQQPPPGQYPQVSRQ